MRTFLYYVLVVHPNDQSVLTQQNNWLPTIRTDQDFSMSVHELCSNVRNHLQATFELILLRRECETEESECGYISKLLIFEIPFCNAPSAPNRFIWTAKSETGLIKLELPVPSVRAYLCGYSKNGLNVHENRLHPYSRPGWYTNACKWIAERLSDSGAKLDSVVQLKTGSPSCLLRATTVDGNMYFMKAIPCSEVSDEVKVTVALSKEMPDCFHRLQAIDAERNWILMRGYGSHLSTSAYTGRGNVALLRKVFTYWAAIQKNSIPLCAELIKLGIPVMDEIQITRMVAEMMDNSDWFSAQVDGMKEQKKIIPKQSEYKDQYLSYVQGLFHKLSKFKVPLSLVHGDLNPYNILENEQKGLTFIDFACTCISFPFLDAVQFAQVCDIDSKELSFYLSFWTEYESPERLSELLETVDELDSVWSYLLIYRRNLNAEENERLRCREEMKFFVC